jgi:DNA repair protein RecO (recombination protein O)
MDALILKATPYEEDGKILKVFTKDAGLISVIVKKLRRKETFWQTLTSPLARGEFHLTRRQSDLYAINEASLIDAHFEIRNDLNKLDAACSILRAILFSQYPEKPSPELYQLTIIYLKKLKTFLHPITKVFFLKQKRNLFLILPPMNGLFLNAFAMQKHLIS